jgi:hypothetical protein
MQASSMWALVFNKNSDPDFVSGIFSEDKICFPRHGIVSCRNSHNMVRREYVR